MVDDAVRFPGAIKMILQEIDYLADPPLPPQYPDLYEVIDGQVVECPPMGALQTVLNADLLTLLGYFVRTNRLGRVVTETLFHLRDGFPERRPDIGYVSIDRWPLTQSVPEDNAWNVVPNLAVEVVSPSNAYNEITRKIREYFAAGVEQVWIIDTTVEQLMIYTSATQARILTRQDTLLGEPLFPGFQLPLNDLFSSVNP